MMRDVQGPDRVWYLSTNFHKRPMVPIECGHFKPWTKPPKFVGYSCFLTDNILGPYAFGLATQEGGLPIARGQNCTKSCPLWIKNITNIGRWWYPGLEGAYLTISRPSWSGQGPPWRLITRPLRAAHDIYKEDSTRLARNMRTFLNPRPLVHYINRG